MKLVLAAAASLAALSAATASATVLTFSQSAPDTPTTATPAPIAGDYGDRVGSAAQGGYTYGEAGEGFTPNVQVGFGSPNPVVVSSGFGDLQDVLYEATPGEDPIIGFQADEGFLVELYGLQIASRNDDLVVDSIAVFDDQGLVFELPDVQLFASGSEEIDFAQLTGGPLLGRQLDVRIVLTSLGGASVDVAVDTFRFGQRAVADAVPLPAAAWLFGAGLAGLIGARRRG